MRMRWILLGGLLVILVAVWGYYSSLDGGPAKQGPASPLPLVPLSPSRYLNVSSEATYVGMAKCVECHRSQHRSYLRTQHSRALSDLKPENEPPSDTFHHKPSGRSYRIYRKDNKLWHREFFPLANGKELLLAEHAVDYLFGSGAHIRNYAVAVEGGFLVESPVSWFVSEKKWAMSPGYDLPDHRGFARVTGFRCVLCHAGRVEQSRRSPEVLEIKAQAIDCERCHGPGSLHVARWSNGNKAPLEGEDLTIVHPGRLSREKKEAICAQCHQGDVASVDVRGRHGGQFRPGLPLTDFRIDYAFRVPEKRMAVVGHFQQMRQSRCYQGSKDMTCTTCHNPHAKPPEERKVDYYRRKCLHCHGESEGGCRLAEAQRLQRQPDNDCTACHMPRTPTDIVHTAFVHHRIGLHREPDAKEEISDRDGSLVPTEDISRLPGLERERCLGLAYWEAAGDPRLQQHSTFFDRRAIALLEEVRKKGMVDPSVDAALAVLYQRTDPGRAGAMARSALKSKAIPPKSQVYALAVQSRIAFRSQQWQQAIPLLEQLVKARRTAGDWGLLSECYHRARERQKALSAAQRAVEIMPSRPQGHQWLARLYQENGNRQKAAKHRKMAEELTAIYRKLNR